MDQPILRQEIMQALREKSLAFPKGVKKVEAIVTHWDNHGVVGFQCLPGIEPGMAGEIRTFVQAWKAYQQWQRQLQEGLS